MNLISCDYFKQMFLNTIDKSSSILSIMSFTVLELCPCFPQLEVGTCVSYRHILPYFFLMIVFILYEENFCPYLLRREFLFLLKIVFFKKIFIVIKLNCTFVLLGLSDVCVKALLRSCIYLKKAVLSGLKYLTSAPFLPIISGML